jgi:hypothetical protein
MTLAVHIHARLTALGISCQIVGDEVHVNRNPRPVKIKFDDEWREAFLQYKRARSLSFEEETRTLQHNNSCEVLVTRLSPTQVISPDQYTLSDSAGNTVCIGPASSAFSFAFFDSSEYENFFNSRIKKRLLETEVFIRRLTHLIWIPVTAVYTHKGRKTPIDLKQKALDAIRASLFKIAVEQHDCLALWKPRRRRLKNLYLSTAREDQSIPRVVYDDNVISFYKVAKASPFPSQSFLAYYHVLEYYFLRVAELLLHDRLTAMLNNPGFRTNRESLDKVISAVRGQDSKFDETEMLRNVMDRFVQETELIEFIQNFEELAEEKIYSKRRTIFGEQLQISLTKDHALANSAKLLKHIRNAIVHSSDRYKREDCHIPLSESEDVIEEFIPLVRFFAERVIFGTAT